MMSDRFLIPFCGIMLTLNALSCDILLPAFFALETRFDAGRMAIQAVVPIYLIAAATGQIVFGPLSDRYGRKPLLQAAIAVYIVGSLLASVAPSLTALYAARFFQGFGAAGMVVLARAILRDTHSGTELARAMALAMAIFTIGPLCAPLLGVLFVSVGGWRGPFVALSLVGAGLMALTVLHFRETNSALNPDAVKPARLLAATQRLFRHPQSRHFIGVLTLTQVIIVLLVTSAPHLFKSSFNIEGLSFALLFALAATGIIVGQLVNNQLIARIGVVAVTRVAALVLVGSAVLMLVLAQRAISAPMFLGLLFVFNTSFLVVVANAVSLVLDPHHDIAGTASALLGCVTQLTGSLIALLIMPSLDGAMRGWSVVHCGAVVALAATVWTFRPVMIPAEVKSTTHG
jgi:MFS transporter, DHA1 family, multidrug resistance protein